MIADLEKARIDALNRYDILDTPPDGTYDRIVRLAATLLEVPVAVVSLVDTDRIWFKSSFGLDVHQIPREEGLCGSAIMAKNIYMVEYAPTDPRTLRNTLVTGDFGLQFYAAYPLTTYDGYNLGTLCVIDFKPKTLTEREQLLLKELAQVVMDELEIRLRARLAVNSQNKMAYMITHDVRGAVASIPILVDMIRENMANPDEVEQLLHIVEVSAQKSLNAVDSFLDYAKGLSSEFNYRFEEFSLSELVQKVIGTNEILARKKGQGISSAITPDICVRGDRSRLSELVDNLLSNAIKFSPMRTMINIRLRTHANRVILTVSDEGQGMSPDDIANAFKRFSRLSARPTANELSTGLGLWIVREIAEKHGGSVAVDSEGKGRGTTFTVELPLHPTAATNGYSRS